MLSFLAPFLLFTFFAWIASMFIGSVLGAINPFGRYNRVDNNAPAGAWGYLNTPMSKIHIYNRGTFESGPHSPFSLADYKEKLPELDFNAGKVVPILYQKLDAAGVTPEQLDEISVGYVELQKHSLEYLQGSQVILVDKAKLESLNLNIA